MRVCTSYKKITEIIEGVRYNKTGKPTSTHCWRQH